jgi:ABC-type Fe3+-hydroxamate transport system substrate-binding protein
MVLERAGARVEVVPMETLSDTFTAIQTVARIVGRDAAGAELAAVLRSRLDAAAARHAGTKPIRVLFCVQVEPVIAAGAGTLPSEILELAGGANVIRAPRYPQIGMEAILKEAPEVILQAKMDTADTAADAAASAYWRRWPAIPAVRDGRVVIFDASAALRPGPRVAEAVERIAGILHPGSAGAPR